MKKQLFILLFLIGCMNGYSQQAWTLRDCINYAIENNVEVRKMEIVREQQEVEVNTAKLSRLPNLNGSASQSFNFGRGLNEQNTYLNRNVQNTSFDLNTNIPLFTGLQIPNSIALNKLNLKAAIEDLNKVKEDISIEVTSAFLQVLFNEEIYKICLEQLNLTKEQLLRIETLHEVGKASISDVYELRARLAQDEYSLIQAENNHKLALLDLSQLLELPSPEGFIIWAPDNEPQFASITNPEEVYNEAVLFRPGILAAQYRLMGAEKNVGVMQSGYYPKLSFGAGIGSSYYNISRGNSESFNRQLKNNFGKFIGFTLNVPLFNRFETRNRVKYARLQQFYQLLNVDESKKVLYKEIQQAYYNAVAAENKYMASTVAVVANETAFQLIQEKYENGKANYIEYNETKMNLTKSQSERIQAKYDYLFRIKILDFYKGTPLNL